MQRVLTAAQMGEVDRLTTEKYGIPSILLMENAAHAVARIITEKLGGSVKGKSILVLCGKGNNGGDGAALARILWTQGAVVHPYLIGSLAEVTNDAKLNFVALDKLGRSSLLLEEVHDAASFHESSLAVQQQRGFYDVVVDALFGTGLTRPLDDPCSTIIDSLNEYFALEFPTSIRVSIDLPSGLFSDQPEIRGSSFKSDVTVTFTTPKPANLIAPASSFNGELIVANIGSPQELINEQPSQLFLAEADDTKKWLEGTKFSDDSYKNKRGHALIIAGSTNYTGAAVLCGNAAIRSGVGLVTIAVPKSSKDAIVSTVLPEVMVRGVAESENGAISESAFDELGDLFEKADSVAVGSGLSQDASTKIFVKKVVENLRQPTIVDADGLNLLSPFAEQRVSSPRVSSPRVSSPRVSSPRVSSPHVSKGSDGDGIDRVCPLILTPHEGEFLRLLGTTDKAIIKDRVAAVREFATKHNVILVLKGERVLIGEPGGKVVVNPTGNSGLGKAGNGDTLTGILAGFVAQAVQMNIDIFETVVAAVYVAGMAGDIAEQKYGKRVMTASDVRECLTDTFADLAQIDN